MRNTARQMSRILHAFIVLTGLSLVSPSSPAHHGAGIFDAERTVTFTGTVTDFQFVNPHVLVYITVTSDDGSETNLAGELTSSASARRNARYRPSCVRHWPYIFARPDAGRPARPSGRLPLQPLSILRA